MIILYRASEDSAAHGGACFGVDRELVSAYLANAGFGGCRLYRYEVEPCRVAEAGDREQLAELYLAALPANERPDVAANELARDWLDSGLQHVFHVLEARPGVAEGLAAAGYDWVVYPDDYPVGLETWRYLGAKQLQGELIAELAPARLDAAIEEAISAVSWWDAEEAGAARSLAAGGSHHPPAILIGLRRLAEVEEADLEDLRDAIPSAWWEHADELSGVLWETP